MAKFIQNTEQFVDANETVVFVNNTDSNFEVGTGIIFRKSGLYEVSVVGNKITVTKVYDLTKVSKFEGMTNGEVMGAVFPKAKVSRYIDEYERPSDYLMSIDDETYFTKDWWNAPYKGGAE